MRKIIFLFIFSVGLFSLTSFSTNNSLSKKLWELSPKEFFKQKKVQNFIDLDNPNEYLLSIAVFQASNELRLEYGLTPFRPNRSLSLAGILHIKEMRRHGFFDHINPYNSNQREPMQRIKNQGGHFNMVAENLAFLSAFNNPFDSYIVKEHKNKVSFYSPNGQPLKRYTYESFSREVVQRWFESPGHRHNLLHPSLNQIGIASYIQRINYRGKNLPNIYVAQEFGCIECE